MQTRRLQYKLMSSTAIRGADSVQFGAIRGTENTDSLDKATVTQLHWVTSARES
jgi:hypothetical protein